jgi:small subunit ribosomal protein S21
LDGLKGDSKVVIKIYENQVERAIKALKRQVAKEGLLKELKRRSFYEKPCVKRKRKQKEAQKKRLKAIRMASIPSFS